jgi:tRNA(Arg) A34 adenosine deaminase TadA
MTLSRIEPSATGLSETAHWAITEAWSAETSADAAWSIANPALGQCAVTACLVQDLIGGDILWAEVTLPDGAKSSHYYNFAGGREIDLTSGQFPAGSVIPPGQPKTKTFASTRAYVMSFTATSRRYASLVERFEAGLEIALFRRLLAIAGTSDDPTTKIACILINAAGDTLAEGANHLPRGIANLDERLVNPGKSDFMEHAERNAIYAAARRGIALDGATIIMRGLPCAPCARALLQSGIAKIVTAGIRLGAAWSASMTAGEIMLAEGNLPIRRATHLPADLIVALQAFAPAEDSAIAQ